jgi:hypothetical protein
MYCNVYLHVLLRYIISNRSYGRINNDFGVSVVTRNLTEDDAAGTQTEGEGE